jgi:hypothetical protein
MRSILFTLLGWSSLSMASTIQVQLKVYNRSSAKTMSQLLQLMANEGWKLSHVKDDPYEEAVVLDFECFNCVAADVPPGLVQLAAYNDKTRGGH